MEHHDELLARVRACTICEPALPLGARPILQMHPAARLLLIGQAPGRKAHDSGIPFDDASGERLRAWLGIDRERFHDRERVAILPMGFCYPGRGRTGDLPPRPECAPAWRAPLMARLGHVELTLVIGQYAQRHRFADKSTSLTERVRRWQEYWPEAMPLPHPSPLNYRWLRDNPWFESELLPPLRERVAKLMD